LHEATPSPASARAAATRAGEMLAELGGRDKVTAESITTPPRNTSSFDFNLANVDFHLIWGRW